MRFILKWWLLAWLQLLLTLKNDGVLEIKVLCSLNDSLGIVTRRRKSITKLLYDHQSILDMVIFTKR